MVAETLKTIREAVSAYKNTTKDKVQVREDKAIENFFKLNSTIPSKTFN